MVFVERNVRPIQDFGAVGQLLARAQKAPLGELQSRPPQLPAALASGTQAFVAASGYSDQTLEGSDGSLRETEQLL